MSGRAVHRVLSVVEGATVTGPLKPLLMFARLSRSSAPGNGATHSLLTTRRRVLDQDPLVAAARSAGVPVHISRESFPYDVRVLRRHMRTILLHKPDILESHDFKSHMLVLLARLLNGRIRRIPWIAFHHGYTRMSVRVRINQQLDRITLRWATRVVTVCKPFVEELVRRGVRRDSIRVLPNAVEARESIDASTRKSVRASIGIGTDDLLIACVGRMSPEKGHRDLLRAFSIAQLRAPDARLILVGDGGERDGLEALAANVGVKPLFLGFLSDPWPLLCASDVFVLPSHSEGSPLVLLEALAARLPIVSTIVGGVPETVTHGSSALLVPAREPVALAEALGQLLASGTLRERLSRGTREALERSSPQSYAMRLLGIYEEVI